MDVTLIEDSQENKIPDNVNAIIDSLELENTEPIDKTSVEIKKQHDLAVVIAYVLMIESGFTPVEYLESRNLSTGDNQYWFNVKQLQNIVEMPRDWMPLPIEKRPFYKIGFFLLPFTDYKIELVLLPVQELLIADLLVIGPSYDQQTYSMCIHSHKYVIKPFSKSNCSKFSSLSEFSKKFKDGLCTPAKSWVLNKEEIINPSLQGMPEEIVRKLFIFLDIKDAVHLSQTCKSCYAVGSQNSLWKRFFSRDFGQFEDYENDPTSTKEIEEGTNWKEEYTRKYMQQLSKTCRCGQRVTFLETVDSQQFVSTFSLASESNSNY